MDVRVQSASFSAGEEIDAFTARQGAAGAVVTFSGIVRGEGGLSAMEIEHYPGMTEAALAEHAGRARERFALGDVLVIHRFGRLSPGEVIMMVATAARHRSDAFDGASFLMDYLKSRAPFWKKEHRSDGAAWVDARAEDETALSRWTADDV